MGGMDAKIIKNNIQIRSHVVDTYKGHTLEVYGLNWSRYGKQLASGGNDNLVHIWDRSYTRWLQRFDQHTCAVKALAWCPFQANLLATSGAGDEDGTIKFWNTLIGACLQSVDTGSTVSSILWSKNERELLISNGSKLISSQDKQLTLWKYPSMVKMAELTDERSGVLFTAQSPVGCILASAAADERLCFWNVFAKKPAPK